MSTLRADIEKLEEAIKILSEIIPEFDKIISNANNIANELELTWDGAASEYFVSKLKSRISPIRDAQKALEYFKNYAEESKHDMQEIDKQTNAILTQLHGTFNSLEIVTANPSATNHTSNSGVTHGGNSTASTNEKSKKEMNDTVQNVVDSAVQTSTAVLKIMFGGK